MINRHEIKVTTAGAAGTSTGSAQTVGVVQGRIEAVHIDYTGEPVTTDVILRTKGSPVLTILTRTSTATDGWFFPRRLLQGTDGADLTTVYDHFVVHDHLEVAVAEGDNAGTVVVTVLVDEG